MIQQTISLFSILKKTQSISVTLQKNPIIAIRVNKIQPSIFNIFNLLDYSLFDITASNHPERYYCNTIYYFYETLSAYLYLSVLVKNHGNVPTASIVNYSALVTERECYEMFGIFFEKHPDLRKLLLDYGANVNPLLKNFPLPGYSQIAYTVRKGLVFQEISLTQTLRIFSYIQPWL